MIHVYNVYKREYLHVHKNKLIYSLLIIKDDRIYYLEDQ